MMHSGYDIWDSSFLMPVAMLVFGALLTTAVVLTIRYLVSSSGMASAGTDGSSRAETLLAGRYSRGEIDHAEYQKKLTLLDQHR